MAEVHGVAGEWARVKGTVMGMWQLGVGLLVAGIGIGMMIGGYPRVGGLLFVMALIFVGFRLMRGMRRIENYFKGARGEEKVSGILMDLPKQYHVFNDFKAGRERVDHVVVGPCGVFAIETKFWRGEVTIDRGYVLVNGSLPTNSPIAQVQKEAKAVKAKLNDCGWRGDVTPVLTFASDNFSARGAQLDGVTVINSCDLVNGFSSDNVILTDTEITRLVGIMEKMI